MENSSIVNRQDFPPAFRDYVERALEGKLPETELVMPDRQGRTRRIRVAAFPLPAEGGPVTYCLLRELTSQAEREARLASALEAKDALLKEVYHRVKNNLTTVASLLSLEASALEDPRALKAFDECQSRIQSMALVHEELYGSGDLSTLDFGRYLSKIAERIAFSFGPAANVSLRVEAESLPLEAQVAVPLGLVANELLTNAFKYAFAQEGRAGTLVLALRRTGAGEALLSVSDDGSGLPSEVDPETTSSLGLQLVRNLARQVEGRAEFRRGEGFECRVTFPVGPR